MTLLSSNSVRHALFAIALGLLGIGVSHATSVFTNPFETAPGNVGLSQAQLDQKQSQTIFTFEASSTGTLQGYFTGGWSPQTVGFQNSVGVYLGAPPTGSGTTGAAAALAAGNSVFGSLSATPSVNNRNADFGDALFGAGGISVTQGQTITFVLLANQTSNTCCSPPAGNNTPHYVWSNESTKLDANATGGYRAQYAAAASSPTTTSFGYNAMAWSTSYQVGAGGVTGATTCPVYSRDCVPTGRNGTIAAGDYTYVGFNDWLAGNSNSYADFSFLFNIAPPPCTGPGCGGGSSGSAPEPGTFALAAFALAGVVGARRRRAGSRES